VAVLKEMEVLKYGQNRKIGRKWNYKGRSTKIRIGSDTMLGQAVTPQPKIDSCVYSFRLALLYT